MDYLPIFLDLKYKNLLVVGASDIALNKIKLLLRSNALISIILQNMCSEIRCLLVQKKYFGLLESLKRLI